MNMNERFMYTSLPTTSQQLEGYLYRNATKFLGTKMGDEKIGKFPNRASYLINIGPKSSGGTHWTTLHRAGNTALYYDPIGMPPPQVIYDSLRAKGLNIIMSTNQHQDQRQEIDQTCGQRAVRMIVMLSNSDDPESIIKELCD